MFSNTIPQPAMTLEEISRKLRISRSRVGQIEQEALRKLRCAGYKLVPLQDRWVVLQQQIAQRGVEEYKVGPQARKFLQRRERELP